MYQRECRTADFGRIDAEARGHSANEGGLAGAEVAGQEYDGP
jgi:hypothetical protein